jgi:uncharacterized membrane protein
MLAVLVVWLLVDAILLACFMWMPVMRGEEAFFGVRVSGEVYRTEGRVILRRYWFWLLMLFVEIEVIGILVSVYRSQLPLARVSSVPLLLLSAGILYVIFYRQVKPYEKLDGEHRFASALKTRRLVDYTNIYLEAAIVLLTVLPTLLLVYYYPQLPERIPVHWDWRGLPDNWTRKSFASVFYLAAILFYMQGLFLLIKHGLLSVKMTLPGERAEEYLAGKEAFLGATIKLMDWVRVMLAIMFSGLLSNIVFTSVERLRFLSPLALVLGAASTVLLIAVSVYYVYRMFKIDRKLKATVGRTYVQRQSDAAHWYAGGLFYYNPEDPSLFVEKLVGWGYTFNMANKWVYVYLAYIVGLPLILSWALTSH